MLANQSKISIGAREGSSNGGSSSYNPPQQIQVPMESSPMSDIELAPLENLDTITLDVGGVGSGPAVQINRDQGLYSNSQSASGPSVNLTPAQVHRNPEEEKKEKIEYLNKLQRLEQKGFPVSKRFTMDNNLDEIKQEFNRLVDARNLESSLRFQRQALMGVVTGMEWMNNRFDPFDLNLEGWSESVHENVEDFDEIFEELYDKYKDRGKMPAEARLVFALAGSGFMCHVSNTFMRQRLGQGMDNVLKNNPELARQFAAAAASEAGPGFGNFMGMAMGAPPQPGPSGLAPPAMQQPTGAFFGSSRQQGAAVPQPLSPQNMAAAAETPRTARREMKGPSGVDDILKTFEEVRRVEMESIGRAPPPINMMPPTQQQPAMVAVSELQSVASDDFASQTESVRTGGGRRGRSRRAAPVGNVVGFDV
jgi:hypothetical protein